MSNPADGASGNAPGGTASGNADDIEQRITAKLEAKFNETLNKMFGPRLERQLEATFKKWAAETPQEQEKPAADGGDTANPERTTLKSLQSQLAELQKQLSDEREAAKASAARAVEVSMRSEIGQKLAQLIGGDNPNLPLAMSHWFDAQKRFARDGEQTFVRFKSQYGGEDDLLPVDDGIKKLVETEGKHLMPSKTAGLPASQQGMRGHAMRQAQQGDGSRKLNNLADQAISSMLERTAGKPLP